MAEKQPKIGYWQIVSPSHIEQRLETHVVRTVSRLASLTPVELELVVAALNTKAEIEDVRRKSR